MSGLQRADACLLLTRSWTNLPGSSGSSTISFLETSKISSDGISMSCTGENVSMTTRTIAGIRTHALRQQLQLVTFQIEVS
jgi:hypothetical protein